MPSNPAGNGLLGQARVGDLFSGSSAPRQLSNTMGITYSIVASQHGAPMGITYKTSGPSKLALLLYYTIQPGGAFAINGDTTIISPDQVTYPLRPVSARTLLGGPLLQGYTQVVFGYSVLLRSEFTKLISYYNPQSPVVSLTNPDQSGTWVQKMVVMRPPSYGTRLQSPSVM